MKPLHSDRPNYSVQFDPRAWAQLMRLSPALQHQITNAIETLEVDPRPPKRSKKLKGSPHYRLRSGDYRIIYDIQDNILLILVLEIDDRATVYGRG